MSLDFNFAIDQLFSDPLNILVLMAFIAITLMGIVWFANRKDRFFAEYKEIYLAVFSISLVLTMLLGTLLGAQESSIGVVVSLFVVAVFLYVVSWLMVFPVINIVAYLMLYDNIIPDLIAGFSLTYSWHTLILIGIWMLWMGFLLVMINLGFAIWLWGAINKAAGQQKLGQKLVKQAINVKVPQKII